MKYIPPKKSACQASAWRRSAPIWIARYRDDQLPGIIALAARRGRVVHHSLHGKMDIEAGRAMEADAIFRIYSMTKPVVSLALMMLHDEGRVMLHDPVSRYIPSFGKTKVYSHISDESAAPRRARPADERLPFADAYRRSQLCGRSLASS